jgi:putative membrane protein
MHDRTMALALVAAWLCAACGAARTRLNDAQIAHVAVVAENGEVEQAWQATDRATSQLVKDFAATMIEQHSNSRREDIALVKQEDLDPAGSGTSRDLAASALRRLHYLSLVGPSQFDDEYMKAQISQHEDLLSLLDDRLIPQASDPALRGRLMTMREMVQRHLADARDIRAGLSRAEELGGTR